MKRLILACAILGMSSAALAADAGTAAPALTTDNAKVGYSIGFLTGKANVQKLPEMDINSYIAGFRDAYAGKPGALTEDQMKAVLTDFQKKMADAEAAKMKQEADTNAKKSSSFLADNAKKSGVTTTASGLQYEVLSTGKGAKPKPTDKVKVNYEGRLADGTLFDSSIQRGEPASFELDQVIQGWTQVQVHHSARAGLWRTGCRPDSAELRAGVRSGTARHPQARCCRRRQGCQVSRQPIRHKKTGQRPVFLCLQASSGNGAHRLPGGRCRRLRVQQGDQLVLQLEAAFQQQTQLGDLHGQVFQQVSRVLRAVVDVVEAHGGTGTALQAGVELLRQADGVRVVGLFGAGQQLVIDFKVTGRDIVHEHLAEGLDADAGLGKRVGIGRGITVVQGNHDHDQGLALVQPALDQRFNTQPVLLGGTGIQHDGLLRG
jgi:FKBP-type peptidyl-prolyl cis-trans isomerase FklB